MANENRDGEVIEWKEKKIKKLVRRIRRQIPDDDTLSFQTRIGKISWDEVAFKSMTPEDCLGAWSQLVTRVRKFRLLSELLDDALVWADQNISKIPIVVRRTNSATHVTDEEEDKNDDFTMQGILSAYEDGPQEKKKKKQKTENAKNEEKTASKPESKKTRRKPEAVHVDSSEENACFLFMKDNKVFKKAPAAIITDWKKTWNDLPESKKKPWIQKAEKQEVTKRDRLLGKSRPPTVPPTVHTYFMQQYLKKNPGIEPKLKFSSANQAWKSLDEESRNEVIKEWNNARREAYEGAREYLELLDPTVRECEEKHYLTAPPAKRKRAASVSVESKPAEIVPKAAKRLRAKSVFTSNKPAPEEKNEEFDNEETRKRRSSKEAIRDRLKSRMRSTSEEGYDAYTDKDFSEADEPVSPSKKLKQSYKCADVDDKISTSRRSMSPEFLDGEELEADEPTTPVLKVRKSPRKESILKLNTSNREKTPESDDFKPKSKKSDKLKSKKVEKTTTPIDNIRVGGESQIDTTGEEDEDREASYVFNMKDYVKPKSKKTKKKILQEDTDKGANPRRTMGETEFINHAGVTSSPKKEQIKKTKEYKEDLVNGDSFSGDDAAVTEPKAPPETAEKLYEKTSSDKQDYIPWAQLPEKNKRKFREALRTLKKKYVSAYEIYLKAQPHHVLKEKANK